MIISRTSLPAVAQRSTPTASGSAPANLLLANAAVGGITWGYAAYRFHDVE